VIEVLPPAVVNQIAAGEVIERPFSVVKELVENSLDAGARRVHVEVEDGGRTLIRVIDDGCGLTQADLKLAFVSHATSKLRTIADLDHIASLGFRGEALASIGAVSRAAIRSRPRDRAEGSEVLCDGGAISGVRPCGHPPGTTVEVRDLFHNTPARRQFLRAPHAERAKIQDLVVRLALARTDVDFTFTADGRQVLRLPASDGLRDRAARALPQTTAGGFLDVRAELSGYHVDGLVAVADAARRDSTLELLYVNGRCAKERAATFAVREAFAGRLLHGRYPVYVLRLTLPPSDVDVNVHPTKAEVRFAQPRRVAGLLHQAVRGALAGSVAAAPSLAVDAARPRARSGFPDLLPFTAVPAAEPLPAPPAAAVREVAAANPFLRVEPSARSILQIRDLYLVLQGSDGLVVVDQHALHERVIYERLQRRAVGAPAPVQRLLAPEVVELTAEDKALALASRDGLAAEGFLLEDFGGSSVAVFGVPAILARCSPRKLLEAFLAGVDENGAASARHAVAERFHSMACRAAVMSGDRLTAEECAALLSAGRELEHPHNCPHGRPTVLTFTWHELERFFKRRP
jgi:DNA mismatch repair protein MutL